MKYRHMTIGVSLVLFAAAVTLPLAGNAAAAEGQTHAPPVPVTAAMDLDGVQRLQIVLDSYSFTPSHIIVQADKPVEFTLKNVAAITPHNFSIDAPDAGLQVDQDVKAGKSVTLRFVPAKPGTYEFYCDKKLLFFPSHRKKGMKGTLEVR